MPDFDEALAVLGGLLILGALVSGVARRSFLSLTALFVIAGFALGEGGAESWPSTPSPASSPRSRWWRSS